MNKLKKKGFFFKLLTKFRDFVNSNDCIRKITSKLSNDVQFLFKKIFEVDKKQFSQQTIIRNHYNQILTIGHTIYLCAPKSNKLLWGKNSSW